MPTIRFLVRTIDAIKPPKEGRREFWDKATKGFGLRISETGRKTWTVLYRHEGRLRRLTVGTYPKIPLARARKLAEAALHEASLGRDPAGEKQQQRRAETFAELAEIYMRLYAVPEKRSWRKDRQARTRCNTPHR